MHAIKQSPVTSPRPPAVSVPVSTSAAHDDVPPDRDLVRRAMAGSRPAFEALVRRHQRPLYHLCLRYVRAHDDAVEVCQRTFVQAMNAVGRLRRPEAWKGWLCRIAVRLSLNHLRQEARFAGAVDPAELPAPVPLFLIEPSDRSADLRQAIARLPTRQRQIVELRLYQELSFREIGQALRSNSGATKVSFHEARKKLRRWLAP
jgi:RNA polymerase sigma factor (sigma-70 family)